ncbi:hypothetical protein SEPCBS119000_000086 [Sporothrix epigloea]|uniref:Uncharacterized protein n=1 Tax=Sporothrix epigloea TaxID=1892477 RepID=A0ABP0D4S7_9PEZI
MEDPDVAWPAWKFGMKRDALFTTLHEQYNTFQSSIQDPNAFHHDVYEIANEAVSTVEFHNLLAVRRDQRLRELNESLESASFEIIANPALIGTKQWEHALQLFRTRSLDSLVRYFASYLPPTHPWHTSFEVDNEQIVHVPSSKNTFFDNGVFTEEPMELSKPVSHIILRNELPPSPRSLTTYSDDMDSLEAHELYCLNTLTPARTLSLSDSDDFNGSDHPKNGDATDEQVVNRSADAGSDPVNNKCFLQHDDDSWQLICPDTSAPQIYAETKVADADSIIALDRDTASPSEETPNNPGLKLLTPMISSTNTSNGHADVNADNSSTTATTDITTTTQPLRRSSSRRSSSRRSSSRRRPLQSGYAVDDADRSYSPLPVSVRIRHRSTTARAQTRQGDFAEVVAKPAASAL